MPPDPALQILLEDNHLLVVNKPAGMATMGVAAGEPSVLASARQYIKHRYAKPGNVYLGVVSRLDAPVSGVLLFARTSKAAARLSEQFRSRSVEKTYWAIVDGDNFPPTGQLEDRLVKDEPQRRMRRVDPDDSDGLSATLEFRRLRRLSAGWLVEIVPHTGRKHQIRVQFADRGWPILGDAKYGSTLRFPAGIALHSRRLAFDHPISKKRIELTAAVPAAWTKYGVARDSP
ncbi:MAG TPA: RluA family pseudouridine synthase [Pirellulales bacterium]|jgi:23S rRNA pseudouridine1911/1915/1917 synthase|nr:RluA family pseudouridine synthase [Pirellulales bacterium]